MKNVFKGSKHIMVVGLFVISATAIAWQIDGQKKRDTTKENYTAGDTTQPKRDNADQDEFRMKDLEDAMEKLDLQMKNLDLHMKDMDIRLSNSLNEAIAKIDYEKINRDLQKQLKNIDFNKIQMDANNSLRQAQQQLKNIDMQKIQKNMQQLQQKFNSAEFKKQMENAIKGAKENVEKAKQEFQELKEFSDELQKDGLIDKKKGYTIEWKKEGDLYISGIRQPKAVSDKYSRFYKRDGYKIEIKANDGREGEYM